MRIFKWMVLCSLVLISGIWCANFTFAESSRPAVRTKDQARAAYPKRSKKQITLDVFSSIRSQNAILYWLFAGRASNEALQVIAEDLSKHSEALKNMRIQVRGSEIVLNSKKTGIFITSYFPLSVKHAGKSWSFNSELPADINYKNLKLSLDIRSRPTALFSWILSEAFAASNVAGSYEYVAGALVAAGTVNGKDDLSLRWLSLADYAKVYGGVGNEFGTGRDLALFFSRFTANNARVSSCDKGITTIKLGDKTFVVKREPASPDGIRSPDGITVNGEPMDPDIRRGKPYHEWPDGLRLLSTIGSYCPNEADALVFTNVAVEAFRPFGSFMEEWDSNNVPSKGVDSPASR